MNVAVVGTGISGMVAAYLLRREHEITVFEANDTIGGHTNTLDVTLNGRSYAVDTGFIVFNEKTYPNFIRLMRRLGLPWQDSEMSFSVKCGRTGLEFRPSTLSTLFVQRRNLLRPKFYRMLADLFRFKKDSQELLQTEAGDQKTLNAFLLEKNYSSWFIDYFIVPMGSAIWSASPAQFREFPARYFTEFFENHGFLNIQDQPQWLVLEGGSRQYIEPLTRSYRDRIRLSCPVREIRRGPEGVVLTADGSEPEIFDRVVIATHSDQALSLLADPSEAEEDILGRIPYQENQTILHTDHTVLPEHRAAWASWNYYIPKAGQGRVAVTYDMNILQGLDAEEEFCVSLNMGNIIDRDKIIKELTYHHPVYTPDSLAARKRRDEINGQNRTYYCGAYWYFGFHEDGVKSAMDVGRMFGVEL